MARRIVRPFPSPGRGLALGLGLGLGLAGAASAGTATVDTANASVAEGNSGLATLAFPLTRGGDLTSRVVVPYAITPGTATAGDDYVAPAAGAVVRLAPNATTGTVNVSVKGDTAVEPDETLNLALGKVAAYTDNPNVFDARVAYTGVNRPYGIASGDFNNDGLPDLATADAGDVSVFLNSGAGRFGSPSPYGMGDMRTVVATDFNGDGSLDLVAGAATFTDANGTTTNNRIVLLQSYGSGFYSPFAIAGSTDGPPVGLAAGDFNNDGASDLVTANSSGNSVSVLVNNGYGSFSSPVRLAVGSNPYAVVVGDFNNDGHADIATANQGASTVSVLLGDGTGNFAAAQSFSTGAGTAPRSLATADVNADGFLDLAVGASGTGKAVVLLGSAGAHFGAPQAFAVGTPPAAGTFQHQGIVAGDFNGDGRIDLAMANSVQSGSAGSAALLPGNGDGTFGAAVNYAVGSAPYTLVATDLNNDGKPDVASGDASGNSVSVLLNNTTLLASLGNGFATGTLLDDDTQASPAAFSFATQTNANTKVFATSNTVTISGVNVPVTIGIGGTGGPASGAQYQYAVTPSGSSTMGAFTSTSGTVNNGDSVAVRLLTSDQPNTPAQATLTVGGSSNGSARGAAATPYAATFKVTTTAQDDIPDAFSFPAVTNVARGAVTTSSTITPTGFNFHVPVSVSSGGAYSINGGDFTSGPGTLNPGDKIAVQQTSSARPSTATTITLNLGQTSGTFKVTTRYEADAPAAFSFPAVTSNYRGELVTSSTVTPGGNYSSASVSITSGSYTIIHKGVSTSYSASGGTMVANDSVYVQQNASATAGAVTSARLTLTGVTGSAAATFQVTAGANDPPR